MVLMLPNAYGHCLFTVTVSDMKRFMCVMVVVVVVVSSRFYVYDGGGGGVCVRECVSVSVSVCMEWVVFIAIA